MTTALLTCNANVFLVLSNQDSLSYRSRSNKPETDLTGHTSWLSQAVLLLCPGHFFTIPPVPTFWSSFHGLLVQLWRGEGSNVPLVPGSIHFPILIGSTNIPPTLILNFPVLEAEILLKLFAPWLHVQEKKKASDVYKREWQGLREIGKLRVHIPFGSIFCLENILFWGFFHLYIYSQQTEKIHFLRGRVLRTWKGWCQRHF